MLGLLSGFGFMSSPRVLGAIGTGDRWKKYDLIGKAKLWFAISGVVLAIGAIAIATTGLNEGIDFTGGSKLDFSTGKPATVAAGRERRASTAGVSDPVVKGLTATGASQGNTFTRFEIESHFLTTAQSNRLQTELGVGVRRRSAAVDSRSVSSSFGQSVLQLGLPGDRLLADHHLPLRVVPVRVEVRRAGHGRARATTSCSRSASTPSPGGR